MELSSAPTRASFGQKLKGFFTAPPCPGAVFLISTTAVSAISVAAREKKVRSHAVLPLRPGLVEPHFDKKNIQDPVALADALKRELVRLHYAGEKAACLLPEPCLRIFVFSFESLPMPEKERRKLFLWRAKKQLPLLPDDIRLSYQVMNAGTSPRVLVSLARASVLDEYENVLQKAGIKVGLLTTPTLSLLNLVDWEKERDFLLVNVTADSTSLVAVSDGLISLFRIKPHSLESAGQALDRFKVENVMTEIDNTIHFLEDREKRTLSALWLHSDSAALKAALGDGLRGRFSFPVKEFNVAFPSGCRESEKGLLVPLFGQMP